MVELFDNRIFYLHIINGKPVDALHVKKALRVLFDELCPLVRQQILGDFLLKYLSKGLRELLPRFPKDKGCSVHLLKTSMTLMI